MKDYVKNGIMILNDTTNDLKNLNGLGIYLAKQTDINALKTLKLMILAHETGRTTKSFDINTSYTYTYLFEHNTGIEYKQKENITGNLSMNPQNFALELMEYISNNYPVNFNFECFGSYSILDIWLQSFKSMDYDDTDFFYKRYDMVDKKMDIIEFMIKNGLLKKAQVINIIDTYQVLLENKTNLSKEQLQRMKSFVSQINQYYELHKQVSFSKKVTPEEKVKCHDEIDRIIGISRKPNPNLFKLCRENAENEIQNYRMQNDQCIYMLYEIPKLIKEKRL